MKKNTYNILLRFSFSFFLIIGIVFIIIGFNNYKIIKFDYQENNNIKYKVYLKKNNFFENDYLEENRTYISSLIDYIDINYHYNIKYAYPVKGEYTYKIVAIVSANKTNSNDYYWKKEYDLTDEKRGVINDSNELSLDENIQVNYDKYNQILKSFKKEYGIASDGVLKIAMVVNHNSNYEEIKEPIIVDSNLSLSVPLMEQTVEASIQKDVKSSSDVIEYKDYDKNIKFLLFKIAGGILILVSLIYLIYSIKTSLSHKRDDEYNYKLDKILKNYDSIIANVNNKPTLTGLKKIEISDFDELLDIYNEVRMPINYYQDSVKNSSTFVIYNDTIAWIYELKKDDFLTGGDNSAETKKDKD